MNCPEDCHNVTKCGIREVDFALSKDRKSGKGDECGDVNICDRCSSIDFKFAFQLPFTDTSPEQISIANLGPVTEWSDQCRLCRIFVTLTPPERRRTTDKYSLWVSNSKKSALISNDAIDKLLPRMNVLQLQLSADDSPGAHSIFWSTYLLSQPKSGGCIRLLEKDLIDFAITREWLQICVDMHTQNCGSQQSCAPLHLKFIDCDDRKLVQVDGKPYVTLSYLWGTTNFAPGPQNSGRLPFELPGTIEDAIVVTKKLGFRYLWVDRYCIGTDQENETHKGMQLQQMNLVYRNSEVTIIAAAGDDPSYGLPGVGFRNRNRQPHVQIGEHFVFSTLGDIQEIEYSRWATRAWTYQEGMLSRRRLIFTNDQVYFECLGMFCHERLNFPLREMHELDGQMFSEEYRGVKRIGADQLVGNFPVIRDAQAKDIFVHIENFSAKDLTYHSDRHQAFLGILEVFQTGPLSIRNCWGAPMLPNQIQGSASEATIPSYTLDGFITSLTLGSVSKTCVRIPSLPSWCWTGWYGKISCWPGIYHQNIISAVVNVQISFELLNGEILKWKEFHEQYHQVNNPSRLSRFIHISAWTVPLNVTHIIGTIVSFRLDLIDGCHINCALNGILDKDEPLPLHSSECHGLILATKSGEFSEIYMLIIRNTSDVMQPVGGAWISGNKRVLGSQGWSLCNDNHLSQSTSRLSQASSDSHDREFEDCECSKCHLEARYGSNWWTHLKGIYQNNRVG